MANVDAVASGPTPVLFNRWTQLVLGIICMALVANLQYAWTLFVVPIESTNHWGAAAVQTTFTIFIVTETWLVPFEGWLVDKFGPRPVVMFGAFCAALGWLIDGYATSLSQLYIAGAICGIGAGCVYGTCVGTALKWFPDKRGLAAGLTAAGFGAGAALTVIPISHMIRASGYQHAFVFFGLAQGIGIFILALMLIRPKPPAFAQAKRRVVATKMDYSPRQMVRQPVFWVMYVMFVMVAAGGVIATAQLGPIAKSYGFAKMPMTLLGLTLPLLTMTLSIDSLCNGFTRPLCGFISDRIGRENAMLIIFCGEGVALLGMMRFGHDPVAFMFFAAMTFLCWGEIYSIFPATCADTFGSKFAASNAGTLYTAKGTASLLVPLASILAVIGSWNAVFLFAATISIAAGLCAKFVLQPMRKRWIDHTATEAEALEAGFHAPAWAEAPSKSSAQ